jgi:hypothetical protein
MSATHYMQKGLTFAILYGSSFTVERTILERLRHVADEAAHPLLLPGIFAELELVRHTGLVDININEVESLSWIYNRVTHINVANPISTNGITRNEKHG